MHIFLDLKSIQIERTYLAKLAELAHCEGKKFNFTLLYRNIQVYLFLYGLI